MEIFSERKIIEMLRQAGIRPSIHRLSVLEYVANNRTHPVAEEIYEFIASKYTGVSKTTVYNSLHTLVEAQILRPLEMGSNTTRYDLAIQKPHSHFKCKSCGKIFDMNLPADIDKMAAPGFRVESTDLHFAGVCPKCIKITENK